ncbi:hypothetical protein GW950_00925 [Candidatus Wolfebacteria bacterium]|nr:hypothetical protein [Candidatus Wolfebacteria bacterium]
MEEGLKFESIRGKRRERGIEKEVKQEKKKHDIESLKEVLDKFLALEDIPKTTYEQQNEFLEKSQNIDDPEEKKRYGELYEKSRMHKFVGNKLVGPLMATEIALDDENLKLSVSKEQKKEILERVTAVRELIDKERATGMTQEIVDEVVDISKTMKKYLK